MRKCWRCSSAISTSSRVQPLTFASGVSRAVQWQRVFASVNQLRISPEVCRVSTPSCWYWQERISASRKGSPVGSWDSSGSGKGMHDSTVRASMLMRWSEWFSSRICSRLSQR